MVEGSYIEAQAGRFVNSGEVSYISVENEESKYDSRKRSTDLT